MTPTAELTNRPIFKPSEETERIIKALQTMEPRDVITWQELHDMTGLAKSEKGKVRACLNTARKHLLSEHQRCFACIRGIGIKRLEDGEVVAQEGTTTVKVRRAVKLSMRRLSTVNPSNVPPLVAQDYRVTSAALGAIALCVQPSSVNQIRQLSIKNGQIDPKAALALFS